MTDLLKLADRIEAGDAYDPTKNNGWLAGAFQMSPKFSIECLTSLTDAESLHDAVLPGWEWSINWRAAPKNQEARMWAEAYLHNGELQISPSYLGITVFANVPAAAWVSAIIRATYAEGMALKQSRSPRRQIGRPYFLKEKSHE